MGEVRRPCVDQRESGAQMTVTVWSRCGTREALAGYLVASLKAGHLPSPPPSYTHIAVFSQFQYNNRFDHENMAEERKGICQLTSYCRRKAITDSHQSPQGSYKRGISNETI